MSLRLKQALLSICTVLIVFSILIFLNDRFFEETLSKSLESRTDIHADHIEASLTAHMLGGHPIDFQELLLNHAHGDLEEIRIFDPETGIIKASSIPTEIGKSIYPEDLDKYRQDSRSRVFQHTLNGRIYMSKVQPIYNFDVCHSCHDASRKVLGVLDVEVSPEQSLGHPLRDLRHMTLVAFGVFLLVVGVSSYVTTGHLVAKPLAAVIAVIRRATKGDLSARYHTPRIDEVGHLAKDLNGMIEAMNSNIAEMKRQEQNRFEEMERLAAIGQMTTQVAHDIKNPLAAISSALQVIADDLAPDSPGKDISEEIQHRILKLDRSIRDLRNYANPPEPRFIPVELSTVLASLTTQINREVATSSVDIDVRTPSDLPLVEMDPEIMVEAFRAVSFYCIQRLRNGGKLQVSARKRDELEIELTLEAVDGSPGSKVDDSVFDPLRPDGGEKVNLGLAASRRIIQQHHGMISANPSPQGGIRFTISMPVSQKLSNA